MDDESTKLLGVKLRWRKNQSTTRTLYRCSGHGKIMRLGLHACNRYRCRQIPAFCDDTEWPILEWEMLFDQNGEPLSGEAQETSWFYTPEGQEGV